VSADVFVDCVRDELRYLALVNAMGLGIISRDIQPPPAVDIDKRLREREGSKILYPNGMQGQ
jgi:hypothetical protein